MLQKKRKKVAFNKTEVLTILNAYLKQPTRWNEVIRIVKADLEDLTPPARQLYKEATNKQLKDRISSKLSSLLAKYPNIPDDNTRLVLNLLQ